MKYETKLRAAHCAIASIIALCMYGLVIYFAVNGHEAQQRFDNITSGDVINIFFSIIVAIFSVAIKLVLIGLPLALTTSALYLKYARFSLLSSVLIPLCANIMAIALILLSLKYIYGVSFKALALFIPFSYIIAGLLIKPKLANLPNKQ